MSNLSRSRWAAIGAAVAVSLGAGGIGISQATSDSGDGPVSAFFPIEPCRLADTRPAPDTVGSRTTGIGPAETYDLDGWGAVGDCTLPNDITGLSLNVTAVGATDQTNLRFFPEGAALPTAANLNPSPGAPATPNAVTVALNDASGQFSVYNAFGTVAVVIDVVGYYDDHTHSGTRNMAFPALALNENAGSTVIEHDSNRLDWDNNFSEAASIFVRQPADWTGEGDVVVRVIFRRSTANAGNVAFFVRARDYDDGDAFLDSASIASDVQGEANQDYQIVTMTIPANQLPKEWWEITLQRDSTPGGVAYPDSVYVYSVDVEYEARL